MLGVVQLRNLDLNLLVSLDALLQQRSVTRAAEQLGVRQPTMSAALARLRRHFGDELLLRVGNGYQLTALANQLATHTRLALAGAERVFAAQSEFDPATSTREFSLSVSDYGASILGPALSDLLAQEAPEARLRLSANTTWIVDNAEQSLTTMDGLVMPHGFLADMPHSELYRDDWVLVVAADNALIEDRVSIDQLRTMPWVLTYHGPSASTSAARQMRTLGIEPRVRVIAETFLAVPALVAGSDRIALLQRRLAAGLPVSAGIRWLACPFDAGPLVESLWWHPAYQHDSEHRYFRDLVLRAAQMATGPATGPA